MCHSVDESDLCPEGQRLYMTAWGETVCDCVDGTFPTLDGKCHQLFGQGNCNEGYVMQFDDYSKRFQCASDRCYTINRSKYRLDLPYAMAQNGKCIQFGSLGHCNNLERFGFNIDALLPECISFRDAGLFRSRSSFQYSYISFPSSKKKTPHYEVSYLIVNGNNWELMTRKMRKVKREISVDLLRSVKFPDTRDFLVDADKMMFQQTSANNSLDEFEYGANTKLTIMQRKQQPSSFMPSRSTSSKETSKSQKLSISPLQSRIKRLGSKRRKTAIPGIINAPLLNQCRPGAKRDYNGYCRSKIIPGRLSFSLRIKKSLNKPTLPRLKCKRGKKLDSRGICRKTFRGLG